MGSSRKKVCSFCLIEADGAGNLSVTFEQGPGGDDYPTINRKETFCDPQRPPTYLQGSVETAVGAVLDHSVLVARWLEQALDPAVASTVAIDAPVALASTGEPLRQTEAASTQTFKTPDRPTFEGQLRDKGTEFLRVNAFWKCVGFAVYRHFARRLSLDGTPPEQGVLAAWTCPADQDSSIAQDRPWRLRETFPSDVYKRANGHGGILDKRPREILSRLVDPRVPWDGTGPEGSTGCRPTSATLKRLRTIRDFLRTDLRAQGRLCEMRKRAGTSGDLWDAFACAFTACCEDGIGKNGVGKRDDGAERRGVEFHGWTDSTADVLRREGAIMTVASVPGPES